MSAYDELTFAPVLMEQIFLQHRGKGSAPSAEGTVPYIVAASRNNSHAGFVTGKALFPGNWLAVVNTGAGGVGYCTYQPVPFWASNNVTALEPIYKNADPSALLALAACVRFQTFGKFTYGNIANMQRIAKTRIMLPVTTDDPGGQVVDWEGMTRLGEELMSKAITDAHRARTSDLVDVHADLPELRFEPMFITDVFKTMKAAKKWFDLRKAHTNGDSSIPYVARSGGKNGIGTFLPRQGFDAPNPPSAITIGVSTSTVFYQPAAFYTSKEIQVLRHPRLNAENGLVLVSILRNQMQKFAWGNGASLDRLKATRIMVPVIVESSGERVVDWDVMTRYGEVLRARSEQNMEVGLELPV